MCSTCGREAAPAVSALELSVTVLDAELDPGAPMWGDATDDTLSPGVEWVCSLAAAGVPVRGVHTPEADGGAGLLIVPEPAAWPDALDRAAAAGRPLITDAPPGPVADRLAAVRDALGALVRPDLRGVLVLRLDDPGASVGRHLNGWRYEDVSPETWAAFWDALSGFGRVSVFCCPGFVEDDGRVVDSRSRKPGEWAALDEGVRSGLADLECHGYTHMHPDTKAWASAPDRHDEVGWFREFRSPLERDEPAAERQAEIIAHWQAACGRGTSLVAPGEAWGLGTLAAARDRGLELFTSWGVCRLQTPVPTWSRGIASPYLDEADAGWFAGGLPVVGYWHDRDMAIGGPRWVGEQLERWRDAGARRAWAFADLARAYRTPIRATLEDGEVRVRSAPRDVPLQVERRR